jgi:hypothetical protein
MNDSFEREDGSEGLGNRGSQSGHRSARGAGAAAAPVDVLVESDYEDRMGGSHLATGLSQITSRLIRQLATSDQHPGEAGAAATHEVVRDFRGSRVPWDGSPPVAWNRVIAVSPGGKMLALVCLPADRHARERP